MVLLCVLLKADKSGLINVHPEHRGPNEAQQIRTLYIYESLFHCRHSILVALSALVSREVVCVDLKPHSHVGVG